MKFSILDHEGKGLHLYQALVAHGHEPSADLDGVDLFLTDIDWAYVPGRRDLIQQAHQAGAKVALYPHGGLPTNFVYDGLTDPDPLVDLRLEHGPGSVEIAELLDLQLPQVSTGWLYSDTQAFTPARSPSKLLFAPMHPNIEALQKGTNGHDPAPSMNQKLYKQLLELGFDLAVSIVAPPWRNGLWAHPKAEFIFNDTMNLQVSEQLVEQADVVVAAGTLAALAVAKGKPTVMFGQGDFTDYVDGGYREAEHAELYADLCRYPLDVAGGNLTELIEQACAEEASEWRERWIGSDGAETAVGWLEELVPVSSNGHVFIQGVTAKSGAKGV